MPAEIMDNKILLVDGNALVHRAFHAIPPLTTAKGELVNAVYGFFSILLGAIKQLEPQSIMVAFDEPGPTFRDEIYPNYKATRVKAPQGLYDQIPIIKSILRIFEIPILSLKGFEADDIIGTLCQKINHSELIIQNNIIILTGDKDSFQLINKNVAVLTPKKGLNNPALIDQTEFTRQFGFQPEQLIDYKALRGDPSDNIPGVAGIGEKIAQNLIIRFQNLDNIYIHLDDLPLSTRKKLADYRQQAYLSKKLATINCQVPLEFNLEQAKLADFDRKKIEAAFLRFGFTSLIKRLPLSDRKPNQTTQKSLFEL